MKYSVAFVAAASLVSASPIEPRQANGNGPYGAVAHSTDAGFADHTIYIPSKAPLQPDQKFPVLVWGNGGCGSDGLSNSKFLGQVASHGYLVIASGRPGGSGSGQTTAAMMKASIDYAVKVAGTSGKYAAVDASKIAAAGFSCGGVEAMAQAWDSRVKTLGIFSSGLLTNYTAASTFTKPVWYFQGGSGDIAYANGERDFKALPRDTISWKGNLPLGHGGDLFSTNGGKFGKAGLLWLEWLFKGSEEGKKYFADGGYRTDGWAVETKNLDKVKPF